MTLVLVLGSLTGCGSDKKDNKDNKDNSTNQSTVIDDGIDTYEILVDDTNRSKFKIARDYLDATTGTFKTYYIIATIGKKTVIYSFGANTLRTATEDFVAKYVKHEDIKNSIKTVFSVPSPNFGEDFLLNAAKHRY